MNLCSRRRASSFDTDSGPPKGSASNDEEERGEIEGKRVGRRWTKGAGSHSAAVSGHVIRIKPATREFSFD